MANETHTLIQRTILNASAASVTFSSIPQTFTDLVLRISGRSTYASPHGEGMYLSFNGLNTNMTRRRLYGLATGSGGSDNAANSYAAYTSAASQSANAFGNSELYISNYTTSSYKSSSLDGVAENNAADAALLINANLWSATAAITSITITPETGSNLVQYTTISLYGVAKSGVIPTGTAKASGGDVVTNDGTYWYHAFKSSGAFTPFAVLTCEALVIAGGGTGGGNFGAGGGAGGVSYHSSMSTLAQSYPVIVGAGGASMVNFSATAGTNSSFNSVISNGGGLGSADTETTIGATNTGGSGGGGKAFVSANGGIATQGNTGGATGYGNNGGAGGGYSSGGGGGAGAVGGSGSGATGGTGGAGLNTWSTWASATSTGVSGYFAGGAGGFSNTSSASAGGSGGGGSGATSIYYGGSGSGGSGPVNSGSGGGGSVGSGYGGTAGLGGSGIVIIRYLM